MIDELYSKSKFQSAASSLLVSPLSDQETKVHPKNLAILTADIGVWNKCAAGWVVIIIASQVGE